MADFKTTLRLSSSGTLHPNRWFSCVVKSSMQEANMFMEKNEDWALLQEDENEAVMAKKEDRGLTKKFFAVVDESAFGIIDPNQPLSLQMLASKNPQIYPNMGLYPAGGKNMRLAKVEDFEKFRISADGYKQDRDFIFPESAMPTPIAASLTRQSSDKVV